MSATANHQSKELYEFGPYRIDPEKEILLRAGVPVPLMPKTFQILLVLVRHSNEVVSKDDLMKAVWPDTFVEETNLTRNIFTLRKALGEDPPNHRYIVTVAGRGYRLTESVRLVPESELSVVAAEHTRVQVLTKQSKSWVWFALVAGLLVIVAAVALRFRFRRSRVLSDKDTLVLADFANSTGDPVFDDTLRQGLAVQLEQSPYLNLISDERIQHTLRLMGQSADARITPQIAQEVCERTGSAAVLEGPIASLGSEYVLGLRARNCSTGADLDEEQIQVSKKENVLNALSQIARKFRLRAGESLATIQKHDMPLPDATTTSLEALKAYSTAWKVESAQGPAATIPYAERAIKIDPKFALAYVLLGDVYRELWEPALGAQAMNQAYQLRNRVTEPERFFIMVPHDLDITGNIEKAQESAEL